MEVVRVERLNESILTSGRGSLPEYVSIRDPGDSAKWASLRETWDEVEEIREDVVVFDKYGNALPQHQLYQQNFSSLVAMGRSIHRHVFAQQQTYERLVPLPGKPSVRTARRTECCLWVFGSCQPRARCTGMQGSPTVSQGQREGALNCDNTPSPEVMGLQEM
jgi:hypothetical protein